MGREDNIFIKLYPFYTYKLIQGVNRGITTYISSEAH